MKAKKRLFISVMLLFTVSFGSVVYGYNYSGGSGTAAEPYLIETPWDLDSMRHNMSAHFKLVNNIDLTAYLAGKEDGWAQIPDLTGSLNGNGYIIKGFRQKSGTQQGTGLVKNNRGGIYGLGIEADSIIATAGWSTILVNVNYGTIETCHVKGTVAGTNYVSGITSNNGSATAVVRNCYANVTVTGTSFVGAIVGQNNISGAKVENCYATGTINCAAENTLGIIGGANAGTTVTGSYIYEEMIPSGTALAGGTAALTETQMKTQNSFAGWDFSDTWMISDIYSYKFPRLKTLNGASREYPVLISTPTELYNIRDYLDKHYMLINDIDLTTSGNWIPVGTYYAGRIAFTGTLNGNGHTISGLWSDYTESGLFGYALYPAEIKYLRVKVRADKTIGSEGSHAGILIAVNGVSDARGATISQVSVEGSVYAETAAGGLAGYNSGHISDCYGNVFVNTLFGTVGGLVGEQTSGGVLKNSYAIGSANGSKDIAGSGGSVSNCFISQAMAGTNTSPRAVALSEEEMQTQASFTNWDFQNIWMFSEENPVYKYPVLRFFEANSAENPTLISNAEELNSIRNGLDKHYRLANDIDLTEYLSGSTTGWKSIGSYQTPFTGSLDGNGHLISGLRANITTNDAGLFGWMRSPAVIKNLGIETADAGIKTTANYAGILASANGNTTYTGGEITNCYVRGKVSAATYTGGFFAITSGNLENCFADVTVTGGSNTGALAGSFVKSSAATENPQMKHCYATGSFGNQGGDIVGTSTDATYVNCYINESMAPNPVHAAKLTEQEMKTQSSFEDWDFDVTWIIFGRSSYKYPVLQILKTKNILCGNVISEFPWTEDFENEDYLLCWTNENVSGKIVDWTHGTGSGDLDGITTAHEGAKNMYLYNPDFTAGITKYITPQMDISGLHDPVIKFWYGQKIYQGDQDVLRVYYKTSAEGTWNMIFENTSSVDNWTEAIVRLPEGTDDYYVAFEGTANWGYGICLDDVTVEDFDKADAEIISIVQPVSGIGLGTETVKIVIGNNGSSSITNFTLKLEVNDAEIITDTYTGVIESLKQAEHIFSVPADLSAGGDYVIKVTVTLANDETADNNSVEKIVTNTICDVTLFPWKEDFSGGITPCWNTIDADGDGMNWMAMEFNNELFVTSESYSNAHTRPLTPDNYLITPRLHLANGNSSLKFNAGSAQDAYAAEKYAVMVSTTGTDPDDFTAIHTETLVWSARKEVELSLNDFKGQAIYIAFRHFDCTDQYLFILDDVEVSSLGVVSTTPADEDENMAPDAAVSAVFSMNITAADLSGITIAPNPGNVSASVTDNILTIAHNNFDYDTEYTVTIPAGTIKGYTDAFSWSFTTMPNPAPVSISVRTPDEDGVDVALNAPVSVTFDRNITGVDLTNISISPNVNATASVNGTVLSIAHADFDYETRYTVTVPAGSIANYDEAISWSFTTISDPAPVITVRTPDEDDVDVALNAPVSVTFDRNITGIDLANISISPNVNATASVNGTVLSIAHADFDYETRYTVTIPAGSIANYDEAISWSFTTISGTGISGAGLSNINLYPNPAQTRVTLTGLPENATVALYDLAGSLIRQYEADYILNINIDFESGTYLVKVEKDGQSVVKKLVVE